VTSRKAKRTEQVFQLMRVVDRALVDHGFGHDVRMRYPQAVYLEIEDERYSITVSRVGR
jgi:hypothetical protein